MLTSTLLRQAPRRAPISRPAVTRPPQAEFHAQQLNAWCAVEPSAHILAIACGEMREAVLSTAIQHRFFGRLVGVDRDDAVLSAAARQLCHVGVETFRCSIATILSWPMAHDGFDYIYSTGLYAEYDRRFCRRLTRHLFEMLRPGGRLLLGSPCKSPRENGSPGRSVSEVRRLADDIPVAWRSATETLLEPSGTAVYLDVVRCP